MPPAGRAGVADWIGNLTAVRFPGAALLREPAAVGARGTGSRRGRIAKPFFSTQIRITVQPPTNHFPHKICFSENDASVNRELETVWPDCFQLRLTLNRVSETAKKALKMW